MNTYKLFANCIPSRGINKSIIIDLQRGNYKNIPNSLYDILKQNEILDFEKLKIEFNSIKIINEYKKFLLDNEFIFKCTINEINHFPKISTVFEKPYKVTNAIVEYSEYTYYNLNSLKESFDHLGIQDCFLIFYNDNHEGLIQFLEIFNDSRLLSIQV